MTSSIVPYDPAMSPNSWTPYRAPQPGMFENFMNSIGGVQGIKQTLKKGGAEAARIAGKYGPGLSKGVTRGAPLVGAGISLMQGDVLGAGGAALGGVLGGMVGGPLAPVTAIAGSMLGGTLGSAAQAGLGNLISGAQARQMEAGETRTALGLGEGKKIGDMTAAELQEVMGAGYAANAAYTREMMPLMQQHLDQQQNRQMQLNQQLGQITGALNKQKYMAGLAGGAQQQAGATGRAMINSVNPYADSVFRYQG